MNNGGKNKSVVFLILFSVLASNAKHYGHVGSLFCAMTNIAILNLAP